ncbi:sodium/potassium-transporting ATPase subunit beta-1-interacting protein 3-like [Takifugu rubripes]|uniref:sodium/potassium-transporting ATPase subunit beta-1-interacting protein 3-like n=1 Tax=Takifugu rubripes TaxID=31033 RepID=UPI001145EA7C|nr:sodium/potassium-transporting ATPase subunit beta-1-interacting protein 3-like [Takifugu rubripes]
MWKCGMLLSGLWLRSICRCLPEITALERQVSDFLGYQWAPIITNFLHVVVVVLGLFGVTQCRFRTFCGRCCGSAGTSSSAIWIWGVFQSSVSLQESDVLSLGVSLHRSWWKDNGPRCDLLTSGWQKQANPELTTVASCWLEYQYVEVLHCVVSLLGFVNACVVISAFAEDDALSYIGEIQHSKTSKVFL